MYALVVFLVEQPAPSPRGFETRSPWPWSCVVANEKEKQGTGKTGGIAGAPNMQRYAEKTVEESRRGARAPPSPLAPLVRLSWQGLCVRMIGCKEPERCRSAPHYGSERGVGFHSAGWPILSAQQTIGGRGGTPDGGTGPTTHKPRPEAARPHNGIIVGVEQDDRTLTISCSRVTNGETSASARPMWLGKFGDPWTLGRTGTLRLRSVGTCSKSFCKGAIACPSSGWCPMYIRRRLYVTQEGWEHTIVRHWTRWTSHCRPMPRRLIPFANPRHLGNLASVNKPAAPVLCIRQCLAASPFLLQRVGDDKARYQSFRKIIQYSYPPESYISSQHIPVLLYIYVSAHVCVLPLLPRPGPVSRRDVNLPPVRHLLRKRRLAVLTNPRVVLLVRHRLSQQVPRGARADRVEEPGRDIDVLPERGADGKARASDGAQQQRLEQRRVGDGRVGRAAGREEPRGRGPVEAVGDNVAHRVKSVRDEAMPWEKTTSGKLLLLLPVSGGSSGASTLAGISMRPATAPEEKRQERADEEEVGVGEPRKPGRGEGHGPRDPEMRRRGGRRAARDGVVQAKQDRLEHVGGLAGGAQRRGGERARRGDGHLDVDGADVVRPGVLRGKAGREQGLPAQHADEGVERDQVEDEGAPGAPRAEQLRDAQQMAGGGAPAGGVGRWREPFRDGRGMCGGGFEQRRVGVVGRGFELDLHADMVVGDVAAARHGGLCLRPKAGEVVARKEDGTGWKTEREEVGKEDDWEKEWRSQRRKCFRGGLLVGFFGSGTFGTRWRSRSREGDKG
ncbi:hypothetical protein CCM_06588 [Cordyceps militaris CM01]|uniref:Uncharacterized protein n=1 Tax=Cordyceps militaris (strain CM01) TaxID=983644 RepID=G3JMY7_CORMM|nr:uncharacterized protein CCM_06588 [Cordyceps militaris CM01]EGX90169.1 hypothetical protein CCM_06588 [Cordyceps militaris CM01]